MDPPHFIIIGAQRCGTTSLFEHFKKHANFACPIRKELHYFDKKYRLGPEWYRAQFPPLKDGVITGEASPYYLFHPHVPKRIQQWNSEVKLIVLLRNPVDRAYSHYHHEVRRGHESLAFEQAIEAEKERLRVELERLRADEQYYSPVHRRFSYLSRGVYVEQLEFYRQFFAREQMLILQSEELYQSPDTVLRSVADFLAIPPFRTSDNAPYNTGYYAKMSESTRRLLVDYFRPHNARLYDYLQRNLGWDN
jgi:hypothetical protein